MRNGYLPLKSSKQSIYMIEELGFKCFYKGNNDVTPERYYFTQTGAWIEIVPDKKFITLDIRLNQMNDHLFLIKLDMAINQFKQDFHWVEDKRGR